MAVAIVLIILTIIGIILDKTQEGLFNRRSRKESHYADSNLYRAFDGNLKDKETDELRFIEHRNGDLVTSTLSGQIVRNMSEEKEQSDFERQQKNHQTTETVFSLRQKPNDVQLGVYGMHYKDYQTGAILLHRAITVYTDTLVQVNSYIDAHTLEWVRVADNMLSDVEADPTRYEPAIEMIKANWEKVPESQKRYKDRIYIRSWE